MPAIEEKLSTKDNKDKDKKKSKSKLKSGKQTKSTAKVVPTAKKGSTNTSPTSQKKALQGLLVLRPPSVSFSSSNSNSNSRNADNDAEVSKKSFKNDRSDSADSDLSPPLPSLIVGRSSKQNDRITFVIAKEHHLWFHVQVHPYNHPSIHPHDMTRQLPCSSSLFHLRLYFHLRFFLLSNSPYLLLFFSRFLIRMPVLSVYLYQLSLVQFLLL